jgi:predicted nucleic acid-binding protein
VIVVDASAMVQALIGAPADAGLLARIAGDDLCAPHLIDFEVTSALRGHVLGRKLAAARAQHALTDFAALAIVRYDGVGLLDAIWRLRSRFTVYDAAYVTLAQALGCPLLTVDGKMAEATRLGVDVQIHTPAQRS